MLFAGIEAQCFVLKPGPAACRAEVLLIADEPGLDREEPIVLDRRSQTRPLPCRSPIRQRQPRPRHRWMSNEDALSLHVMAVEIPAKRPSVRDFSSVVSLIKCVLALIIHIYLIYIYTHNYLLNIFKESHGTRS